MVPIVVAVIWHEGRLVLQLRDFRDDIADAGQWGFFGGHLTDGEQPETGLRRELSEELGWAPKDMRLLGAFDAENGSKQIIGFEIGCDRAVSELTLKEGQEVGAFTPADIETGAAYSRRWNRTFRLTSITCQAMNVWCRLHVRTW